MDELEKLSIGSHIHMNCMECKKSLNFRNLLVVKCGCTYCLPCLRTTLFSSYSNNGFKNLCESNEKEKLYNSVQCSKHQKNIPFNVLIKCLSLREMEYFQYKSSNRMESFLNNKKIHITQKLAKFCCVCGNVVVDEILISTICKNNHFSCKQCLQKLSLDSSIIELEIDMCPFQDCNSPFLLIQKGRKMNGNYLSNI